MDKTLQQYLEQSVEEAACLWRDQEAVYQELRASTSEWMPLMVYLSLTHQRRFWRRYLRSRFGYVIRRDGSLYTNKRHWRPPRTLHDLGCRTCALQSYVIYEVALRAYFQELNASLDSHKAAVKALDVQHDCLIHVVGMSMTQAPHPDQRTAASFSLAGWADTQIRVFERLRYALQGTSKRAELPSAVYLAWPERQPGEPLTGRGSTISRIAKLLTSLGLPAKEEPRALEPRRAATELEAIVLSVVTFQELVGRAGLSEREARALGLHLDGHSHRQIAQGLGVSEGTANQFLVRAKKKLEKAAAGGR